MIGRSAVKEMVSRNVISCPAANLRILLRFNVAPSVVDSESLSSFQNCAAVFLLPNFAHRPAEEW